MSSTLTDLMHDSTEDMTLRAGFTDAVVRGGRRRRLRARALAVSSTSVVALACVAAATTLSGSRKAAVQYGSGGMRPPAEQLQTFCLLPAGGRLSGPTDLIGPTGDPVDNCGRFWRYELKTSPPALVAYQDRFGNVTVQAQSEPLPEGSTVLPSGVVQNAEGIEIAEALGDRIGNGPDRCLGRAAALANAQRVVTQLGFAHWPVQVDESRVNPAVPQCWSFAPRLRDHVVTVGAIDGGFDYPPVLESIARPLRASLTECWSRGHAIDEVRTAVAASSLADEFKQLVEIREVDVPAARCTIVRMGGGGGISFTLRGPA